MAEAKKMKKSLYLLTGATGLLGSNLIRILLGKGYPVRVLVLPGDPAGDALPLEVEKTQGDVCDADSLTRFFGRTAGHRPGGDSRCRHCNAGPKTPTKRSGG